MGAGRFRTLALAVFCCALLLRLVLLWELHDKPVASMLVIDSKSYDLWARQLAAGDWLGDKVYYQAPLYPYFLGLIYRCFGANTLLVTIIQSVLGAASCLFLTLAGRRFFGPGSGLLAGALLALYPTAIFNDSLIQKSSLDLFFMTLLLLLLSKQRHETRAGWWLAAGVVLGALVLTRENALTLLLVFLALLAVEWRRFRRLLAVRFGLLMLGLSLMVAPVAIRNYVVGREFVLTTSLFGMVLYMGNNPAATGSYQPLVPGRSDISLESRDATALAEKSVGHRLTTGEVSQFWASKALKFMTGSPGRWTRLMGRKVMLLFNRVELGDTYDQYSYQEWSHLLRWLNPLLHFGVLIPAAAMGLVLTWPERRRLWVLHAVIVVYSLSIVIFFVLSRYRFPLVPVLILFSAAGAVRAVEAVRCSRYKELGTACLVALLPGLVANWPLVPRNEANSRAAMRNNIAMDLIDKKRYAEALPYLLEAMRLNPHVLESYLGAGSALAHLGRHEESLAYLLRADRIFPGSPETHYMIGRDLSELNRTAEAVAHYQQALSLDPSLSSARFWLARELEKLKKQGR
jgi:4-amino-4-deoxy-L-arabinose transferase-like glycosyltransferase